MCPSSRYQIKRSPCASPLIRIREEHLVFPPRVTAGQICPDPPLEHTADIHQTVHMAHRLVLASASGIRATLLRNAGLQPEVTPARIDEDAIRASLEADQASARDVADALAEYKARRVSNARPDALVLGCDQIAEIDGMILTKPDTGQTAKAQLKALSGKTHRLMSAAVLYRDGAPKWRHIGVVRMSMRDLSDAYIDDYVARNWNSIRHSVGGYKLEEEGVRLFSRVDGDYFHVLGLPLTEFLSFLIDTGEVEI